MDLQKATKGLRKEPPSGYGEGALAKKQRKDDAASVDGVTASPEASVVDPEEQVNLKTDEEASTAPDGAEVAQDDSVSNYDDGSWEKWQKEREERDEFRRCKPWMLLVAGLVDPMEFYPDIFKASREHGLDEYRQALKDKRENPEDFLPERFRNWMNEDTTGVPNATAAAAPDKHLDD